MNIKRIGLCVLALIVVGISYWLAVGVNYDTKTVRTVSYTHLDVYKRQVLSLPKLVRHQT